MSIIEALKSGKLFGNINVDGSKNAALPIIAASLMVAGVVNLENCPDISDVGHMCQILEKMGCVCVYKNKKLTIDSRDAHNESLVSKLTKQMRASSILAGPVIGRFGMTKVSEPGGCMIGKRPLDVHIRAFRDLGATVTQKNENNECWLEIEAKHLHGTDIYLRIPSVGATENVVMAAVNADGITRIYNAAKEPEVYALCDFINCAGGCITGAGSDTIKVVGGIKLHEVDYRIPVDRIAAGTYLCAVVNNGGDVLLKGAYSSDFVGCLDVFTAMGARINNTDAGIRVASDGDVHSVNFVKTEVYPGFSTDMQPVIMSLLAGALGKSVIEENIFENRFGNSRYLTKMGANIIVNGKRAYINGVDRLYGADVTALDLRSTAALVLAGIKAEGTTIIRNADYIERGYSDFCGDLKKIGARVQWKKQ